MSGRGARVSGARLFAVVGPLLRQEDYAREWQWRIGRGLGRYQRDLRLRIAVRGRSVRDLEVGEGDLGGFLRLTRRRHVSVFRQDSSAAQNPAFSRRHSCQTPLDDPSIRGHCEAERERSPQPFAVTNLCSHFDC